MSYIGRCYCSFGWLGISVLLCAGLRAQDTIPQQRLRQVEVTTKAAPSTIRSTAPLQTMDSEAIRQLGIQSLSDVVRRFAGVSVKDYGGIGGLKTVSIRGFGVEHTAVLYDGVAVSDIQSGQIDIGRFSIENVSMVGLSIGQSDNIFQPARSFASAGILNIETRRPEFEERSYTGTVQARGGSFGQFNPSLYFANRLSSRFSYSLNGDWQRADGNYPFQFNNGAAIEKRKRLNSDVDIWRGEANLYGSFGRGGDLTVKGSYFNSDRGLPGSVISDKIQATDRLWDEEYYLQAAYRNRLSHLFTLRADAKFARNYSHYKEYGEYAEGFVDNIYRQREYYASAGLLVQPLESLSVSLAQDVSRNELTINYSTQDPKRTTSLTALQAKYESKWLTFTAGLLGTYAHEWVKTGDKAGDKKRLSPVVTASWQPVAAVNLRIRGSYKDIYRLPTFNDLYYFRIGNTNLRPEIAKQYNIGATWITPVSTVIEYVSLSVDGYYNKVKDKIIAISPGLFVWKMMNAAKVDIKGVDVNLSSRLMLAEELAVQVSAAYSYQSAVDLSDPTAKNYKDQVTYTPRHTGSGSASFQNPWVNIAYSLVASGERYWLPANTRANRLAPYWDHTVSLNRTVRLGESSSLRLQADLLNLSGKNYEVIHSYPMPGRSFRVSAAWTF